MNDEALKNLEIEVHALMERYESEVARSENLERELAQAIIKIEQLIEQVEGLEHDAIVEVNGR